MSFRLLWLLLSLFLVPVSAPAHAAITALFESPPSGPVSGVQVVRGWAFVTEPGDTIARVELVVDGAPAMTIPCCGERADVAAAHPQYPPAVTLRSGWGLTLNWSLLPPGLHTVQVAITTAQGQQWRSEVRVVEVVTVGGFEFLDLLSLADATARLEGDEIVLENVWVRDKASGQEREATLGLRWDPNAQTLSLSRAVTTVSLTSLRSTLRGVLTPMWQWLARASGAREVQAGAGIVSEWESPSADALVSGVQVIRGWMFAEEVGVPIAVVRVMLDGRTATTLPCCSARGDVAAAFPDNPNALESGAALVVNYGNLTAGPHVLGLEIEAANGAMVALTRAITVLKIGGFDFLDQFDLSQAAVRLEGEEIVLTDVRVREETSGHEKVLTLRFRWDTATQGFVLAANDPPVASDQRLETEHNHAVGVTLRAQDADGDRLRFEVVDGPAHGQLTGKPPLVYYTPDPGFLGEDHFTFLAQDFASASNVATVTITVTAALTPTPTNDPPQVDLDPTNLSGQQPNFTTTFTEDSGLQPIVSPLMTVIDPDSATLASATATLTNVLDTGQEVLAVDPATVTPNTPIVATYNATTGELRLTGAVPLSQYQAALRTLTYTNASQNPNPTDRLIRVVANDGAATSTPVTSTVSIRTVNDQPTFTATNPPAVGENAGPQTLTGWATFNPGAPEETGQTVLAYTVSAVSNPGLFTTSPAVATDGTLTYTPAANTTGTSTFTVTVQDNGGTANGGVDTSAPQTFTITVTVVDDPPVAVNDGATVAEDAPATTIPVLANDTDIDAGPISIGSVTQPTNGTVVITNGGADLMYQPNPDYCNIPPGAPLDTFTYTLTPGSSVATVSVTVTCGNDAPVVDLDGTADDPGGDIDVAATFTEGTSVVIVDATNLTVSDPDNPNLASATVTITNLLDAGVETLTATATGSITVNYVAPTLTLSGSDTLANYQHVLRTVTYNNTSQNPTTTARLIDFIVNDGTAPSAPATSTVTINAINTAPSFTVGPTQTVNEEAGAQTVSGWATAISDGDGGGQTLTFNVTGNTNAALFGAGPAISPAGVLTYTPAAGANGTATITITLSDDGGTANGGVDTSAPQSFTITVTAVNDAPSFTKGPDQTVLEDSGPQTVNGWATSISAGPADEASQTLTFNITGNTNAALFSAGPTISPTGTLTYTPAGNAFGSATITITLSDSGSNVAPNVNISAAQSFTITVTGVNDAPSFIKGADQTVNEDAGPVTVNPWATAISAGPANEGAQTLTFNLIGNTNPGLFSAGPAISASGVLMFTSAPNANGSATITLTLSDNGGTANGGVDTTAPQMFTITVNPVNDPPSVTPPAAYAAHAHIAINIPDGATDLFDGSTITDVDGPGAAPFSITAAGPFASTNGGSVTIAGNGSFTYNPPVGFTGANDTFLYQICDSGVPGSACTDATATVTVSGPLVWFVNNALGAAGDGRLSSPFNTLAAADSAANAAGDRIFVFTGASTYTSGFGLLINQRLIGQGVVDTDFDTALGIAPPATSVARPAINGTRPTINGTITLATGVTARGFNVSNTTVNGVTGSGATGLTINQVSVTTTTGVAVNLANSGGTVSFTSVSANGAPNGIVLQNTNGSFTVTGDGVNTAVGGNSSGGTIQNMSGADGAIAGNGVYLNNTQNVTLRRMTINGTNQNHGIRGTSVSNFTLEYSTVTGTNGTSIALDEGSVNFDNLLGSAAITNCVIEGGLEDNLNVVNTSGTLNRLTITGSTFGFNNTVNGNNNILIEAQNAGTVLNFTLQSSLIKGARADWLNASNNSSSTMDAVIGGNTGALGNTFDNLGANAHPGAAAGGNRVVFGAVGPQTVDIRNNTLKGSKGEAIRVRSTATGALTGTVNARVRNNTIGVQATANSGSSEGSGIFAFGDGGSDMTIAITDNQVFQYNNHGIRLQFGDEINDGSVFNATVTGNTVNTPGTINTDFNAIILNNGTVGATDNFTTCADIGGAGVSNNIVGGGKGTISPNNQEFRLQQRQATTVRLPGYGGANNNNAAVVSYIQGRNTVTAANGAASNTVPTGGGFIGGAACTLP